MNSYGAYRLNILEQDLATKEAPAMVKSSRSTYTEAEERMRADNPYVDVERLQSALDAERGSREGLSSDTLTQTQRRCITLQPGAGRGLWLAFVNAKAKV